jgi:stage II sporulation protein D
VRLLTLSVLSLTLVTSVASAQPLSSPQASEPGEAVFVVSGRGWGHGVGMSQYGAYGQAKEGRTYGQILRHYYSGTEIGTSSTKVLRVLLAEGRRAVTIFSRAPFRAVDAAGTTVKIPAGPLVLTPELRLPLPAPVPDPKDPAGGVKPPAKAPPKTPAKTKPPLMVVPGKAPLSLDGRAYRGKLQLALQGGFLRVVNHVAVEDYLQGVVADEMPHTWPLEALKAQAVAARSYALRNLVKGKPFDLYSDWRSQVYGGIAAEEPQSSEAVRATAGRVVTYGGQIASTYYFSTSGGKTASAADVFGLAVPYLVSRPDPWDRASPHHRWGPMLFGARTLQSKLGIPSRVLDASGVPTPSGRLRSLALQTVSGPTSVPGSLLRTGLGLRSTWITMGVLRLDRPRGTVEFGSSLRLTGIARSVTSPKLTASVHNTSWTRVGALERAADGSVSRSVQPERITRYRIEADGAASQALLVNVSPRVRLVQQTEDGLLTGTVRPRLRGARVVIERQRGSGWVQVAQAGADAAGSFRVKVPLVAGEYRARVPATGGLVEGFSPLLTIAG